ncbi:MAG TPA: hypothetical protein VEV17_09720 [Bryobacteraceae bacterium]|nr:hypothetical protein [Bryobacteraceae bacterium]
MRFSWACLAAICCAGLLQAADKKLPIEQTSNELVEISANALIDKDQIRQELGSDLGGDIVVVRVTIRPVSDKPLQVSLDDFLLVSAKDGQRSEPFAPSQIAGNATLVVTPQGVRNGGLMNGNTGPTLGIPGVGTTRMPGGGSNVGNGAGASTETDAKVETKHSEKENPVLAVLTAKVLPEKETTEALSGLLYFQMAGKLKPKDLELHYKGPGGRLALRFRP